MAILSRIRSWLEDIKAIILVIAFLVGLNGWQFAEGVEKDARTEQIAKSANEGAQALVAFYSKPVKPEVKKQPVVYQSSCKEECQRIMDEHINSWRHK